MRILTLLTLLSFAACANPYEDAKQIGTIEAYDAFLKANPKSTKAFEAKMALENLYVERARSSKSLEDYDSYLKRFYEDEQVSMYDKIKEERRDVAFDQAIESDDTDILDAFIKRYKTSDPNLTNKVRRAKKVAAYSNNLEATQLFQEQVNLQGDSSGPLDGWMFSLEVTNNGDQTIDTLNLKIEFLDIDGNVIKSDDTTVVGIGEFKGREWLFESEKKLAENPKLRRQKPPFKAGETREWVYTTGDIPPSWAKQVKTRFSAIVFSKE